MSAFGRATGADEETPAEVEAWLDTPSLDIDHNARVALVDGTVVGYADLGDPAEEGRLVWTDVRVDPAHPEASRALLDFAEERAHELAPAGLIKAWAPEQAADWRSLLESRGFELHHYSLRMHTDLASEPPEPEWPDGISVRSFQPGEERTVYEIQQETFSDQRDFTRDRYEDWQHWSLREPFDPELWFLALAGDEVQGIALCRPEWHGDPNLGWVSVLGVRKPWRRKGLGLALLLNAFRELRARGKTHAGLGVDAENPTGAVRLYERAGMELERRHIWYDKPAA